MLKRYWKKGLGLVVLTVASMLVGGFVLAGLGGHSALAQLGTTRSAVTTSATIPSQYATLALSAATTPDTLRDRITDMMKDHMGFTDQQASDWADTMTGHMQAVHGDWTGTMLDQMDRYMDQYVYGHGMINGYGNMMNGSNSVGAGDMMGFGRQSAQDGSTTTVTSYVPGSMMDSATRQPGAMMGAWSTPSATTTTTATSKTAPSAPAPVTGGMMGGNAATPSGPGTTVNTMMGVGGMGFLN